MSANFVIVRLKNGEVKFVEENKIIKDEGFYRYEEK